MQAGMSLVELLVGMALGPAILATALSALALQGRETLRAWRMAQLSQAVSLAGELIARDLRRAGHWADATRGIRPLGGHRPPGNPYASIDTAAPGPAIYRYARDSHDEQAIASNEVFGVRLRGGALELQLGAGNWQALTDSQTVEVTRLGIATATRDLPVPAPCDGAAAAETPLTRTHVIVRSHGISIEARSAADPSLSRSFETWVRVRSDATPAGCEDGPA